MTTIFRCTKHCKNIMKGAENVVDCVGRPSSGVTCKFCTFNIERYKIGELTHADRQSYMEICKKCPCNFCKECVGFECKCYTCKVTT